MATYFHHIQSSKYRSGHSARRLLLAGRAHVHSCKAIRTRTLRQNTQRVSDKVRERKHSASSHLRREGEEEDQQLGRVRRTTSICAGRESSGVNADPVNSLNYAKAAKASGLPADHGRASQGLQCLVQGRHHGGCVGVDDLYPSLILR